MVLRPKTAHLFVNAVKAGVDHIQPIENPETIVKSLAIGNPADAYYAVQTMRKSGGKAEAAHDEETVAGIRLLATTEGALIGQS